ncbi:MULTISPECIES: nitronate monooxygenase family protein [unclassified Bacillus (in: firmicutes)]|uniref:NAD(P)H-dependent flavin oxidoreductase n=1 Tax=unclassified Bacillus (in: firmicutes) TaxID=185979 RepID=UPI00080AF5E7|nr:MULTISPECIES: nitronate monooxygenase [unclassified Bacillus (in: firmicutes)]OCA86739.1 2-nitropropane dioxygenase [Bacillus sp. FJAT-27986]
MRKESVKELAEQSVLPIIVSPMFIISTPEMVLASCNAGVIGTFPTLNARTEEQLEAWFQEIKDGHVRLQKEHRNKKIAPWGVNLIVHSTNHRYESDLALIKKYQPPIVITSLGKPVNEVKIVHEYGGLVFSDVISIKHAKKAAEAGVDGLILVCNGAGGHGGTLNPFAFIAEVKQFWNGIIILAGCISNGQEILAAKVLGADFVYMGTRFIASLEAVTKEGYKEMLIESNASDIIYTNTFSGVNANYLTPSIKKAGLDPANLPGKSEMNVVRQQNEAKAWKDIWSAGQGVGSIKDIQPIESIIKTLQQEYEKALDILPSTAATKL